MTFWLISKESAKRGEKPSFEEDTRFLSRGFLTTELAQHSLSAKEQPQVLASQSIDGLILIGKESCLYG